MKLSDKTTDFLNQGTRISSHRPMPRLRLERWVEHFRGHFDLRSASPVNQKSKQHEWQTDVNPLTPSEVERATSDLKR